MTDKHSELVREDTSRNQSHKIVYLTSGAAGMYCGSCMHDNTLVRALIRQGHDVQLIPTYTPIRTDEQDVSADQVFFGGINVYLQQRIPLFRHVPRILDRFLDRPGLIRRVSSRATNMKPAQLGKLAVSMLKGEDGGQKKEVQRLCGWLARESHPDLVVFTNILIGGCIPEIKQQLGAPIIVTLQGDDVFLDSLPEPWQSQALAEIARIGKHVDRFVTHSHAYADAMSNYLDIDRDKIEVTPLGLDTGDFEEHPGRYESADEESQGPTDNGSSVIGYFARLAPEKGLHLLVDAFISLRNAERENSTSTQKTRLLIGGWLGEHQRGYADEQFTKLNEAGLEDDYEYVGSVDREGKLDFFRSIDLLCVPTVYHEPKGLFALESMAAGVPVVLPSHGAFPEMIDDTGGGILFDPDSPADLVAKLVQLTSAREIRSELGNAGRNSVLQRRSADSMGAAAWDVFEEVIRNAR